jgi:ABC-type multidrug transport system ATPase subunit
LQFSSFNFIEKPQILILDEPFEGLDFYSKKVIVSRLIDLKENEGVTILISTHNFIDLQNFADEITIIDKGFILYSGKKTKNIEETFINLVSSKEDFFDKLGDYDFIF